MPDYEINADTDANMMLTLNRLGMTKIAGAVQKVRGDGFTNGVRFSVYYYGTKTVSGVAQPGVYAILRYMGSPFPPPGVTLPAGVTVTTPLPANSGAAFA